jgi:hypothetical protein
MRQIQIGLKVQYEQRMTSPQTDAHVSWTAGLENSRTRTYAQSPICAFYPLKRMHNIAHIQFLMSLQGHLGWENAKLLDADPNRQSNTPSKRSSVDAIIGHPGWEEEVTFCTMLLSHCIEYVQVRK